MRPKLNIGIVTTWFARGAAYVSKQYRDVLLPEANVFIYARAGERKGRGDPDWDGDYVWWGRDRPSPYAVTVFDRKDFANWIKERCIQIVIFNEQHWWPPIRWCKELGVKAVAYVDYYTEETIPLFRYYDALLCNTRRHYEAFSWHPRAWYIPWGTDCSLFHPPPGWPKLVGNSVPVFFHSAGCSPGRKGTLAALHAFHQSGVPTRLVVHTQVDQHDAADLNRLSGIDRDMVRDMLSQGRLQLVQHTVGGAGLYSLGDVYLYPTALEGIGLTIAESMASGLVPVVTDAPPMNEFVTPECGLTIQVTRSFARSDGYYWPKSQVSVEDLAAKIRWLCDNPALVEHMKVKAREHALQRHDWKRNAPGLADRLRELVHRSDGSATDWTQLIAFERSGYRKLNDVFLRFYWVSFPLYQLCKHLYKRLR